MHTTRPDGTHVSSSCDFCQVVWDPYTGPYMIEGHQGSLVCSRCLSIAYADVVLHGGGHELTGQKCTMCLEEREQPQWQSPVLEQNRICLRCIRQGATAMEKDAESGWTKPKA